MSTKILSILMAVALGFVSASSRATPEPSSLKPPDQQAAKSLSPEDVRELAYSEKRRIGLRSKGIDRCPKVEGWTSESLLDLALRKTKESEERAVPSALQVEVSTADLRLLHKLGLDRYCIYTALPGTKEFLKPSGLVEAERDRMALSTTSAGGLATDLLGQEIWQALAEQFRKQTGQEASVLRTYTSSFPPKPEENGVRLTFLDSQPDGEWVFPWPYGQNSQHGFTLGYLAHSLVCPPSGPCAVMIAARRALCYQNFDPEQPLASQEVKSTESGHVGLVSDLAAAILAEVLHWRDDVGKPRHLILNLSLGWDGELFKDLDAQSVSQLEPSVQAVYKALRFARQSGVLVVVSAGNDQGRESAWPLLPAAWELRRPTLFHLPFGRKRVYAVGGVDSQGLSLPNTREGGHPRRVTYADHSVTQIGADPTAMYTGTSVSATVISSIAAVVWHLRPELTPTQVMRLITRSGKELEERATFYAWTKLWPLSKLAPQTRRLSLCSAVAQVCGPDGKQCSDLQLLSRCPEPSSDPAELAKALEKLTGKPSVAYPISGIYKTPFPDISGQRWVIPQPEDNPCPGCAVVPKPPPLAMMTAPDPQYELVLEITKSWHDAALEEGVDITDATLVIDCLAQQPESYPLTKNQLTFGTVHRISGLAKGRSLEGCKAQIAFELMTTTGSKVVQNPVVVDSRF